MSLSLSKNLREIFSREFKLVYGLSGDAQEAASAAKYAAEMEGDLYLPQIEIKVVMVDNYLKAMVAVDGDGYLSKTFSSTEADAFVEDILEKIFWDSEDFLQEEEEEED